MKKLIYLLSALLVLTASCTKDDDNSTPGPVAAILPKTVKYTYSSNSTHNSTSTVTYDGNKIVSRNSQTDVFEYTYSGNFISKTLGYVIVAGKNEKFSEETFTYTNGKLTGSTYVLFDPRYPIKIRSVYTYNSDGTITEERYKIDSTTGGETKDSEKNSYTYSNGNIVKRVNSSADGSITHEYVYDSKNNPLKNTLGFNLLINKEVSVNNVTKRTLTSVFGTNPSIITVYKSEYVYDANGYPTKETSYKSDGITVDNITEYTY